MSTVAITELTPGTTASSSQMNANVSAWNAAGAAGVIDQANFREEGLDGRSVLDRIVEVSRGGSAPFESSTASPGYGAGLNPVVMGGNPVRIGPLNILATDRVLIRCRAFITAPQVVGGPQTKMVLQNATNPAGPWTTVVTTRGRFNITGAAMRRVYHVTHKHADGANATWYYRLVVEDSPGSAVTVQNAVLHPQSIAL